MTRLFRHSFVVFARLALGLMLLTQLYNLMPACTMAELDPAAAFGGGAMTGRNAMQGTMNNAACLFHCLQDSRAAQGDKASLPLAMDAHDAGPLRVALAQVAQLPSQRQFTVPPAFSEGPLYLRFSHFLN